MFGGFDGGGLFADVRDGFGWLLGGLHGDGG